MKTNSKNLLVPCKLMARAAAYKDDLKEVVHALNTLDHEQLVIDAIKDGRLEILDAQQIAKNMEKGEVPYEFLDNKKVTALLDADTAETKKKGQQAAKKIAALELQMAKILNSALGRDAYLDKHIKKLESMLP